MALKIGGLTVINDNRALENISNLKTVGGQSILGIGDISLPSASGGGGSIGPQGPTGPQGPQGIQGDPGPDTASAIEEVMTKLADIQLALDTILAP